MEHIYNCPKCEEWTSTELKEITLHTYHRPEGSNGYVNNEESQCFICENCINRLLQKKEPVLVKDPEFARKEITTEKREKPKSEFGMVEI